MTLLQQRVPERTLHLEEIIPFYQFLLVDSCLFSLDSGLSQQLYMVKDPSQLLRFTSRLEDLTKNIQMMRSYLSRYNHLYVTPEIQEEITPFITHLRQVQSYHESKLSQQQRELRRGNNRPKFNRWNKRRNQMLERRGEDDFDNSDYEVMARQTLDLMLHAADGLNSLSTEFPVYHYSGNLPRLATKKASIADASLVTALMDYVKKPDHQQHAAAILTADGDIIQLFHGHLQTLSPSDQRDLSSRAAVHFWSHLKREFIRLGYFLPQYVRETEGQEWER